LREVTVDCEIQTKNVSVTTDFKLGSKINHRAKLNFLELGPEELDTADDGKENVIPLVRRNKKSLSTGGPGRLSGTSSSGCQTKRGKRSRGLVDVSNIPAAVDYETNVKLEGTKRKLSRGLVDVSNILAAIDYETRCPVDVGPSDPEDLHSSSSVRVKDSQGERYDEEEGDLIGDFTGRHTLPLIQGRHKDLKTINHDTVSLSYSILNISND